MRLIFLLMLSLLPAGKAFAAPEITSSQYNAATGALVVTGTDFEANGGGADVDASIFTLTGEG
ncbi:MAG: hypothetical protein J5J00_07175 [Deltaproteobacteria bacterium]|nr:hypothetical protein [Deltaproteobacteria bacterium]